MDTHPRRINRYDLHKDWIRNERVSSYAPYKTIHFSAEMSGTHKITIMPSAETHVKSLGIS